ncbi:potassium/sodium hyperpolarization-activated cyclic nucleotide-gated channel 2-like isoform X2 [Brachyhypopomus gauderio]|uniref:potassium/sodium hyperpolarization-activated cyclic nucleotide-gated channel 2-like isoform X2 n=1 Tax=Brachyhypopomus gauderio TaxID=698409 RepID=UPI0040416DE5
MESTQANTRLGFFKRLHLPQINKLALSIFGSEAAIEEECDRQQQTGHWVIHPLSPLRHYYVMFMVLLTFVNLVTVPLEMAFFGEAFGSISNIRLAFNFFCDILFLIDICLNFRTGILTEDSEIVLDLKAIRKEYFTTWFIPDILSAVSIDLIIILMDHGSKTTEIQTGKMIKVLMFARVFSLLRVLRFSKLVKFFCDLQRDLEISLQLFFRITFLFVMMILLCHWNGCIQYFVPMLQEFPSDCWIVKENILNSTFEEKYIFCLFRAVSHMVRISYGSEYPPTDEWDIWVVMISAVSGAVMYIMLFTNMLSVMVNNDGSESTFKKKMQHLEDYMTYRKLPRELRARIREYYKARYEGQWINEKSTLSLVSRSLREEILTVMCGNLLKNCPMFQNCDINLISSIILKLKYEVFLEGDVIIQQNAPGDRMFFIKHGQVIVETSSFQEELCDGGHFGEMTLLTREGQGATVRALSTCRLFSLSVDDFDQVLQEYPDAMITIQSEQRCEESRAETCCFLT